LKVNFTCEEFTQSAGVFGAPTRYTVPLAGT
jgi:hypothetical protein